MRKLYETQQQERQAGKYLHSAVADPLYLATRPSR